MGKVVNMEYTTEFSFTKELECLRVGWPFVLSDLKNVYNPIQA